MTSVLARNDVLELVTDQLLPAFEREQQLLDVIDSWHRWEPEIEDALPKGATNEHKTLARMARTPWLALVVTNVAQAMYVDGYRSAGSSEDAAPWRLWLANDLDARQTPIHRAALTYGTAYGTALPGVDDLGQPTVAMRGVSPRKMLGFYADPAEDDWPLVALRVDKQPNRTRALRVYDEEVVHYCGVETNGKLVYIEPRGHGAPVPPVVRFTNQLDLEGRATGEVEPHIELAKRANKTVYDRLMVQHHNSWKVRTVAGLVKPDDDGEAAAQRLRLRQDDMLIAEDIDTKFGTLPETSMDGFIKAAEADVKTLAAASQTPAYALNGDLVNVAADGLAVARSDLDNKVTERQKSFGKSHDQWLRLGSLLANDLESARDRAARTSWADTGHQPLATAADGLGKLATMLGVPVRALWPLIPGVSKTDVQDWEEMADAAPPSPLSKLEQLMRGQAAPAGGA